MCHEGEEYLSGEYRHREGGEPEIEIESEKVFKPHSEDSDNRLRVSNILLQRQPHGYPLQQRENSFYKTKNFRLQLSDCLRESLKRAEKEA